MYRIVGRKLLILIRLVIVVSLAGYSLSNAVAAMHGHDPAQASVTSPMDHHGTAMASPEHHAHHGEDGADHGSNPDPAKQQCCGDFCLSMAVLGDHGALGAPVLSTIRHFIDDSKAAGQAPVLNRPPNI